MPGGDRTGPMGMGPMTGRAAGYCAGYGMPGYMNPIPGDGYGGWGRGFWGGRGRGRGWRNWYRATGLPGWARAGMGLPAWGGRGGTPDSGAYGAPYPPPAAPFPGFGYGAYPPPPPPEQEVEMLREQAEYIEQALADIRKRMEELEAEAKPQ